MRALHPILCKGIIVGWFDMDLFLNCIETASGIEDPHLFPRLLCSEQEYREAIESGAANLFANIPHCAQLDRVLRVQKRRLTVRDPLSTRLTTWEEDNPGPAEIFKKGR